MQNKPLDQKTNYHDIYEGEVFQQSRCIWHENVMMDTFKSLLMMSGYHSTNTASNKNWQRNDKNVVVCFADDFYTCRAPNTSPPVPLTFDRNTTLITDNFVTCATQFEVLQLPQSYFGIYYYQPAQQDWAPERRFNFSVNRIDFKRIMLLLELLSRTFKPNTREIDLEQDLINFNCFSWRNSSSTPEECQDNFATEFNFLNTELKTLYKPAFDKVKNLMPFKNHPYSVEESHVKAWLNIVVETYSGDTSIALSEKIFRALVTPVPWMVYAGQYAVSYLKRLGFDVIDDLVDHRTDLLLEKHTGEFGDKMVDFMRDAYETVIKLQEKPFAEVSARCRKAAEHNQALLLKMRQSWATDFADWLPTMIQKIK